LQPDHLYYNFCPAQLDSFAGPWACGWESRTSQALRESNVSVAKLYGNFHGQALTSQGNTGKTVNHLMVNQWSRVWKYLRQYGKTMAPIKSRVRAFVIDKSGIDGIQIWHRIGCD